MGKKATGHYTLETVHPTDNVLLIATGTGEAPHNAMTAELLARGHSGKIVVVTCVRKRRDLGYLETYRELVRSYPKVTYLTLTTREPENVDPTHPNYQGKRYLQQYFLSGALEQDAGIELKPMNWHVYLCGNPAMIGAPQRSSSGPGLPSPGGMVHALSARGFPTDQSDEPSRVHFEKYW